MYSTYRDKCRSHPWAEHSGGKTVSYLSSTLLSWVDSFPVILFSNLPNKIYIITYLLVLNISIMTRL